MPNTIHCFYWDFGWNEHARLLALWRSAWSTLGWTPIVLGPADAERDPRYDALRRHAGTLPTRNDHHYELACYARWLAYAAIDGITADYDVFPRDSLEALDLTVHPVCGDLSGSPGFVNADRAFYSAFADVLLAYAPTPADTEDGIPHVSDMTIFRQQAVARRDWVRGYGDPGWESVPLTHYNANAMLRAGVGRVEAVEKHLSLLKPGGRIRLKNTRSC